MAAAPRWQQSAEALRLNRRRWLLEDSRRHRRRKTYNRLKLQMQEDPYFATRTIKALGLRLDGYEQVIRDFVRERARQAREQASQWADRGREAVSQQKEQFRSAYEAGRQAYRETTAGAEGGVGGAGTSGQEGPGHGCRTRGSAPDGTP